MTSFWRHSRLTYYDLGPNFFNTMCGIVARTGMASFKTKFPVLQELFAKNHRGPLCPPSGARVNRVRGLKLTYRPSFIKIANGRAKIRKIWLDLSGMPQLPDFPIFPDFRVVFFSDFYFFKKCFRVTFRVLWKMWPKNKYVLQCHIPMFFFAWPFFTGWSEMTSTYSYHGHKTLVFTLASVSDTIHAD